MDPNATLDLIRSVVRFTGGPSADMQTPEELLVTLTEAVSALDEWLTRGGFLPADWANTARLVTVELDMGRDR